MPTPRSTPPNGACGVKSLLVITGLLMISSAVVKLRSGMRAGVGVPVLAPVEFLGGLGLAVLALLGGMEAESGFRFVLAGIAITVLSTINLGLRLSRERKRREQAAGARLFTYVKYLSQEPDTEGSQVNPLDAADLRGLRNTE